MAKHAKQIIVRVIPRNVANEFVKKHHYSGRVVTNSSLHFGCFLDGVLHGVLSYGSSMNKKGIVKLVKNTGWNEFIELNRMAFDDYLPKNSESRCIAVTIRLIKKNAPHIKWIISFADGTQCGDGTIYRASGFVLTQIQKNTGMRIDEEGTVHSRMTFTAHRPNELDRFKQMKITDGYMFRYIYLIDKTCELTPPIIPFSKIKELGASMYKGKRIVE